ncbi:TPA: hypothetical protein SIC78_002266, partial [Pasteurella multocida]|nr:hypothetical protein [Pasteurella multocida]
MSSILNFFKIIDTDYKTAVNNDGKHEVKYSLFYQLSRITKDRGALAKDDRLDSLALGVEYLKELVKLNADKQQEELIEEFLESHMSN